MPDIISSPNPSLYQVWSAADAGLQAPSWLHSLGGCIQRSSLIQLCILCAPLSHSLLEILLPIVQTIGKAPWYWGQGGIGSSQSGQNLGEGFSITSHQPLRFCIYSPFTIAANDTAPSYLLSFISGPCIGLQRRVERCDTDGETKAGGEEVDLPRSASRGEAGSSPGPAVNTGETRVLGTCCACVSWRPAGASAALSRGALWPWL